MIELAWGEATDVGAERATNEDCLRAQQPVFIVADGMGGGVAGERASRIAVDAFDPLSVTTLDAVRLAVHEANAAILREAGENPDRAGMGTTLVGLVLVEDCGEERWLAFNVGDSRLYRLAGPVFEQISTDHSQAQELVDAGVLAEEGRWSHPDAHVITRALGLADTVDPDYWLLCPTPGERFLLCSDGLCGTVAPGEIRRILGAEPPARAAERLVAAAVQAGARDNVTAVVVAVAGEAESGASTGPRKGWSH